MTRRDRTDQSGDSAQDLRERIHPAVEEALAAAGIAVTPTQLVAVVEFLAEDLHRDLGFS